MSQSSRRAWNRSASATGTSATSQVRGPTSALSSFLRERGINAGRLNPYARLPQAALGEQAPEPQNRDTDQQQMDPSTERNEPQPVEEVGQQQQDVPPEKDKDNDDATNETQQEKRVASKVLKALSFSDAQDTKKGKKRKGTEIEKDEKAKKQKGKGNRKGKAKGNDDDSDLSDLNDAGPSDSFGRSNYTKRTGSNSNDSLLKFCQRCLRKYVPEEDGQDTCIACLNIPKPNGGSRKISALKKRRSVLVDDVLEGSVRTLRDSCIKLIADNIDSVEAFGDIPDNVKRSISRILSRRRAINSETVTLFIGPEENNVELFDCAKLKPDSFNQIVLMSPNVKVLHLADCGQINDEVVITLAESCPHITSLTLKGAFLVRDVAFETLLSGPISKNLQHLFLENTAKFGPKSIAALTNHCTNLTTLCLSQCECVCGEGIRALGSLTKLTSFELMDLGNVTDDDLIAILSDIGANLTKLSLTGFTDMSDKVLVEGISKFCPIIQHLSLRGNECLTDEGMLAFLNTREIQHAPLKTLDLHRLYNLTDESISSIVTHHGASLNKFVLNGLDDLTSDALKIVVNGCPAVTELDMSWVRSFNDDLFSEMVGRCRWLKTVKVYGCNLLTEFSLVKKFFNGEGSLIRVVGNEFD